MTDLLFNDVVIESSKMIGPEGEYHTAVCKSCSTKHYKYKKHCFQFDSNEFIKYVAEMKAWNCCHENAEPLDGYPSRPQLSEM